jgi:hypothetical protein
MNRKEQEKEQEYIKAKKLLIKAFNINYSIPKGYGIKSSDYSKFYDKKTQLLNAVVNKIRTYSLPIKYGIGYDQKGKVVTYFEVVINHEIRQLSFHGLYGTTKLFHGIWNGIISENYIRDNNNKILGKNDLFRY